MQGKPKRLPSMKTARPTVKGGVGGERIPLGGSVELATGRRAPAVLVRVLPSPDKQAKFLSWCDRCGVTARPVETMTLDGVPTAYKLSASHGAAIDRVLTDSVIVGGPDAWEFDVPIYVGMASGGGSADGAGARRAIRETKAPKAERQANVERERVAAMSPDQKLVRAFEESERVRSELASAVRRGQSALAELRELETALAGREPTATERKRIDELFALLAVADRCNGNRPVR